MDTPFWPRSKEAFVESSDLWSNSKIMVMLADGDRRRRLRGLLRNLSEPMLFCYEMLYSCEKGPFRRARRQAGIS